MDEVKGTRRAEREARQALMKRNDFSALVRAHVRERDQERCVLCGKPGREVHHIKPRSAGGLGTADNGVCLDPVCHHQAHRSQKAADQLLRYRERVLLPYYGLTSTDDYIWLDPLSEPGRCRCGGEIASGRCTAGCGLVLDGKDCL